MLRRVFQRYCCLLGLLLPQRLHAIWVLKIPPYEEECFLLKTPSSTTEMKLLTGNYEMMDDEGISSDPLLVYIMESGKNGKIVWRSRTGEPSGSFRVPITVSLRGYWMCLQNSSHGPDNTSQEPEHPDHVTRSIGFSFRVESLHENKPAPLIFTDEQQYEWTEKSEQIEHELHMLVNHHDYMRMREADHRAVVEKTFADTLRWTLLEVSMVVIVAVGQVMYFRRFLERKTFL